MATLTVHDLDNAVVARLRQRAAEHGRSEEEEHREILRSNLLGAGQNVSRTAAAARFAEFRERTAFHDSPSVAELLEETRRTRLEQLTKGV